MGIWGTLNQFAKEASMHGPSYIIDPKLSLKKKIIWGLILLGFSTYAGLQLKDCIECKFIKRVLIVASNVLNHRVIVFFPLAWEENLTISTSESMNHPIELVNFPTVTLCPKSSNPDRWGPTIKVFDNLKRNCLFEQG